MIIHEIKLIIISCWLNKRYTDIEYDRLIIFCLLALTTKRDLKIYLIKILLRRKNQWGNKCQWRKNSTITFARELSRWQYTSDFMVNLNLNSGFRATLYKVCNVFLFKPNMNSSFSTYKPPSTYRFCLTLSNKFSFFIDIFSKENPFGILWAILNLCWCFERER